MILALFILKFWGFVFESFTQHLEIFRKPPQIQQALDQEKIDNIHWYGALKRSFFACLAALFVLGPVAIIFAWAKSRIEKSLVHIFEIGKHSKIPVHKRDLTLSSQIALALVNAEQLKQENAGLEKALQIHAAIADLQIRQARALGFQQPVLPAHQEESAFPERPTPTFQQLLLSGEIAPGKPMILGYEHGNPRKGSFLDIYSAAVAGESGSGKTATLLFLIGSGLVSGKIRFLGIDPHYPHPKSLGFKTKPLWESGLMTMATNKDDSLKVLKEVERIIDRRLQQLDTDETPVVLVIDELAFLAKTALGKPLAHTMERISTEGRKCAVYMLASSQTWLVARTGDSSVVRDTLTSAYVHRIKPKQANLLLQDKEEADKVKKYVKQAGDVLLCPVNDDSVVCKMPYTTDTDMQHLTIMFGPSLHSDLDGMFQQVSRGAEPANIQEEKHLSIRQIEKATGIPYSALQRYYSENKPLKAEYQNKLEMYFFKMNQTESVLKSVESGYESLLNHQRMIQ
jgi:ABC-type dipeptide/oligopeptide/nickel transport system ATPase subunit